MSITILIVDDHTVVRDGLRAIINAEPDMQVLAEAEDGQVAFELVQKHNPDVVIMDVELPRLNGPDATARITEISKAKVIALSAHSYIRYVQRMLKSGASGYMLKENPSEEIVPAIRAIMRGERFLSSQLTQSVLQDYISRLPDDDSDLLSLLSAKEREVLQLIAEGKSTREIAERLAVSVHTVATHRSNILERLGMDSVADLIKFAIREGLTSLDM